ncbi:hypothetical protein S40285_03852 [Stachybotrys chlorohalonatus IBT 40285]|uniref:NmrA-like domain-containing protein n=1 Tax=Stachybotrys chlorohalonatus (strain IBT 40285) TaxID=1283841 RepID=A0A084QLY1_STAC4|nr:hypothetical protein S40285_03852 [Stachybotrys chlorohalonata IBT 40285]
MMRIAIAGGTGLGHLLAAGLAQADQAYNVVVLSRFQRTDLDSLDVQSLVVDYYDHDSLCFALQGIDLVISTISGGEQLNLIHAAGQSSVRLFVPSEFEGPLANRPTDYDPLDRGTSEVVALLRQYSATMKYTIFSCGVLMERFSPGGLGYYGIGYNTGIPNAGDYLINLEHATADIVEKDHHNRHVYVCLTSLNDVVRFIVAAVALGPNTWPREYTMRGDRMSLRDLASACGRAWSISMTYRRHQAADLSSFVSQYLQVGDLSNAAYFQRLQATVCGRYDFHRPTLNRVIERTDFVRFRPVTFSEWLASLQIA